MNRNRLKKRIIAGTMAALVTATSVPAGTVSYTEVKAAGTATPSPSVTPTIKPFATATVSVKPFATATASVKPFTSATPSASASATPSVHPSATASVKPSTTPTADGFEVDSNGVLVRYTGTATDIVIPDNVKEIKKFAFSSGKITSVTFSKNLEKIGEGAFFNCKDLKKVVIPENVKEIGEGAFMNCDGLTSAVVKSEQVGDKTFWGCKNLAEVTLENEVKSIGKNAFLNCTSLTEITIPSSVKTVGESAFSGNTKLESVVLEDGVEEIGGYAFNGDSSLKSVKFSTTLTRLGDYAFYGTAIESVDLPSAEQMGRSVFGRCKNLKEVAFRSGVKQIGDLCLFESPNVETVTLEPGVEVIGASAFADLTKVKEFSIPNTVVMIGKEAFRLCPFGNVELPNGIKYIGGNPFGTTPWYKAKRDAIWDLVNHAKSGEEIDESMLSVIAGNVLLDTPGMTSKKEFKVPEGVTVIGKVSVGAEKIDIPDTITGIGEMAFSGCNYLKEVNIADSVTMLGRSTFFGSKTLEQVKLPANIQDIYEMTFMQCTAIKSITIPENVKRIGYCAFKNCTALTEAKLPEGLESIGYEAFRGCSELKELTIPESVTLIEKDAFKDCAAGFIIKGYAGSAAETYAKENNITFQSVGTADPFATEAPTSTPSVTEAPATEDPGASEAPTGTTFTVTLDANGGLTDKTSITVTNGSTYDDLPSASKAGKVFAGWFTSLEGGTKIENTTSVNLTSDQILYAHWIEMDGTLKFDANGGSVSITEKSISNGKVYGELPVPTKTNATFLGWYTDKNGGTLITEDTVVEASGEITVYAHWQESFKKVSVDTLSYNFENSSSGFNYANNYEIPYKVFKYIFGDTLFAKELYESEGIWGGNCYGMSSTSIFFNVDTDDINVSDFSAGKKLPSELKLKDQDSNRQLTLNSFIEAMQISQYDSSIEEVENESWNDLDALCEAVEKSQNGKGEPVIVCIYGPTGGHAIVGYKVEGNKLYVYDPNFPKDSKRAIQLKKDSDGTVTSWYYHLNDCEDWGSEYANCGISYIPYNTFYQVWKKKANKCLNMANLLKVNTDNAKIYDENNKLAAQIKDGKLITNDPDIMQIQSRTVLKNGKKKEGCEIFLPARKYTIENTGTNKNFNVQIVGTEQSVNTNTTAAKVTVNLDDNGKENDVYVDAKQGQTYNVTLKSTVDSNKEDVVIKGTAAGTAGVGVSQNQGELNFENCQSANISVEGKSVKPVDITAKAGKGGSISREGAKSVASGEDITYAIMPKYGYMVKDVLVDGVSQGNISSYTFSNVNTKHTIEAVFEEADIAKASVRVLSEKLRANGTPKLELKIGNQILSENDDYVVTCKSKTSTTMTLQIKGVSYYKGAITKTVNYTGGGQGTTDSDVKKGSVYTVGNLQYKVTNTSKKTVAVVKKAKSVKSVSVPAIVKIKKISFKVTEIGASVWKNDTSLQSLTVGANVQTIGANACSGAKNLKKITIKGTALKKVGGNALKNISPKAVIKVPKKKKAAYQKLFKGKGQKKTVVVK